MAKKSDKVSAATKHAPKDEKSTNGAKDNTRPTKRAKLLDDDSSDNSDSEEAGGVILSKDDDDKDEAGFKINKEYARRFEHNKKREEMHRLEEKYGKDNASKKRKASDGEGSDEESDSESESEDDDALLATEALDQEINATLQAIRAKDPRVYDKDVTFYSEFNPDSEQATSEKKEKPMFLQDYHRKNLLEGKVGAEGEEDEDAPPRTYAQEQDDLKKSILKEMHAAADSEKEASDDDQEDEDGDFLIRKGPSHEQLAKEMAAEAAKKPVALDVASADQDPEKYLSNFMTARAWLPSGGSKWQAFESDDEDDERRADEFEQAYNLRFEDPQAANEKLISHARDATNKYSVRREEISGRKKAREAERVKKEAEKAERTADKARLRKLKIEQMEEKVKKIKEAAGVKGQALGEDDWAEFLEEGWEGDKWEEAMKKRFGEDYYAEQDAASSSEGDAGADGGEKQKKKKPKKPTWDDDIDIKDLVPDFEDEESGKKPDITLSDDDDENNNGEDAAQAIANAANEDEDEDGDVDMDDADADGEATKAKGKTKKDRLREREEAKRSARRERRKIEQFVDSKMDMEDALAMPGASKAASGRFRYRETSPTAYGLTPRDILMASDTQLNQFAGLKKLAAFRDAEKKRKDKKKLGKKARLRQWRKETFGDEDGPTLELREYLAREAGVPIESLGKGEGFARPGAAASQGNEDEGGVDIREGGKKKKRRSRKNKQPQGENEIAA
ncbi:hypothetical protein L228DRAFT_267520 [Xylona heveae TC161]|uniref:Kri1-like C-terminal domain-containing protein n=1 Tax=Xylona heveae (strain CBS 132557 / TC161) TaxID=1328760 RepID=A0A165HHF1_XYLHT|nr:hypothetical protein L228DRAFT_267520 [Xylona heveae TC161]KZF23523.1 hypothetical protein L228DRAFT_267520 [Xylona heveae TC161]